MIRLQDPGISVATRTTLQATQQDINDKPTFAERVTTAQAHWLNRTRNQAFTEVRSQLTEMCNGPKRCGYCEDSEGYQVEHIAPKHYYPELAFTWENYLYACGRCNGPKNAKCAVFRAVDGLRVDHPDFNGHPPAGESLLINPRIEDPLNHLWLDLKTFAFTEADLDPLSESFQRADFTQKTLRLNERDSLVKARRIAFKDFHSHLRHYVQDKEAGADQPELDDYIETIQEHPHPTVWKEMQRQHTLHPFLLDLFTRAPEALTW